MQLDSGVLESSNVNAARCMVKMIQLSRQFEMQVKALHSADENANGQRPAPAQQLIAALIAAPTYEEPP